MSTPTPWTPPEDTVGYYDGVIRDPLHRAYWGQQEFYNVGLWSSSTTDQAAACADLLDRLLASSTSPEAVLDVGCGLGATTRHARRRWPRAAVHGINLSPTQVDHCRREVPDCDFRVMDAARLDFADGSYDLVFSVEAAFHFNTRRDFFREAHRVLRPGGVLAVSDIIVADGPDARSIYLWDVEGANAIADLSAYRESLAEIGFSSVEVEDVTNRSWLAWCDAIERWLATRPEDGVVTRRRKSDWQESLPKLRKAVRHYLTAVARKPADGAPTGAR